MNDATRRELEARLGNKANYLFAPVPVAMYHAPGLHRLDVAVWATYFARERLNVERGAAPPQLSLAQVAFWTGSSKPKVSDSIRKLVRLGYLEKSAAGPRTATNRGVRAFRTRIPRVARRPEFLISTALDGLEIEPEELAAYIEGNGANSEKVSRRGTGGYPGGEPCGIPEGNPGVPRRDTHKDLEDSIGSRDDSADASGDRDDGSEEPTPVATRRVVAEYEDPDLNGGARETEADLASRAPRRRRLAAAPAPEDPFLRRPSERPEFNRWRKKREDDVSPTARDVVGYWACRFRELRGEEDPELFGTLPSLDRLVRNVRAFTRRWLENDFRRALALVDRILERAEDRGMPVRMAYFFTPAKCGAANALERQERARRGRPETPAERNDRAGADTPANQARIREMQRRFAEERNGSEPEVHRDERGAA